MIEATGTALLDESPTVVTVICDLCNGSGKQPTEWDLATGAVVARRTCHSCLGRGKLLANARSD